MIKKGIMIVGHGSRYIYNEKIMDLQAQRLREMGFENIYIGFNETSFPKIEESLLKMADDGIEEIVAIPFFIASGIHMTKQINIKLGLVGDEKEKMITVNGKKIMMHFETPFGEDPLLAKILSEKLCLMDSKKGNTGVMVIGHGSRLSFNKEIIVLNAKRMTEMGIKNVYYAFNEFDEPTIEEVMEKMLEDGITEIIAMPLFISGGDHLKNDVPEKIRLVDGIFEGTFDYNGVTVTVKYASPIGKDPRLTDLFAAKVRKYI